MNILNQRIRLAVDTSQMGTINDVITGNTPQFWNGVDLEFELAIFYGANLASISNFDSITVEVKQSDPRTGLPLMSQVIGSGSLNNSLTLSAWQGGAATDCHCLAVFTNSASNLNLSDDSETFWLVISALTADSPAHKIVLGATPINVVEGGEGVTPPAYVQTPLYYTAAQSDERYQLTVDLTSINATLATLGTELTTITATATGALPRSGGTLTGNLTLTGLSGVVKAVAGVLTGGATTTDLTEGSNLYYTSARFTAALAAVTNVVSGVCGLDTSGLVPAANLPAKFTRNIFTVGSQSAMLALSANQGDIAVRTDLDQSFVLSNSVPATLANWVELLTPAGAVSSVNSLTGAITLTTTNLAEGTNLYYTTARAVADAITALLTGFSSATGGTVSASDSIVIALGRLENRCALNDAKADGSNRVLRAGDTMTGALQFSGGTNPGIVLAALTDAQRAALTPSNGMIIFNSTISQVEYYNGTWNLLPTGSGTTWYDGAGAPAASLGLNGYFYLDTATGNIYQKTSGTWSILWSPATLAGAYVPLTGGSLTGPVVFTGTTFAALTLNTLTTTQRNALTAAAGNLVFNSTTGLVEFYNGSSWNGVGSGSFLAISGGTLTGPLSFSGTSNPGLRLNNLNYGQMISLASPAAGMVVYCTTYNYPYVFTGTTWQPLGLPVTLYSTQTGGSGSALGLYTMLTTPNDGVNHTWKLSTYAWQNSTASGTMSVDLNYISPTTAFIAQQVATLTTGSTASDVFGQFIFAAGPNTAIKYLTNITGSPAYSFTIVLELIA